MDSPDVLTVSVVGYAIAFVVLASLAVMMRLITLLFPDRERSADAAVVAAITATYTSLSPGVTVTKIEETT